MVDEAIFRKIDRYLKKDNIGPLIVDVQNKADMETFVTHYRLPQNTFLTASDVRFCKPDEFPAIADLIDCLCRENRDFFVRELTSFYMLQGEDALIQELKELLSLNIAGHVVIVSYQCSRYLRSIIKKDKRMESRICIVEGEEALKPKLIFLMKGIRLGPMQTVVEGISSIAKAVENETSDVVYVATEKEKNTYPCSLYIISEMKHPYDVLCQKDRATEMLGENFGTEDDWQYALSEFQKYPSWDQLVTGKVGDSKNLDIVIANYRLNKTNHRWLWLYFAGLKLFGAGADKYLNTVSLKADSPASFVRNIYRVILEIDPRNDDFWDIYDRRKVLLNAIENPLTEVDDFCKIVQSKEIDAIYYLTDNTQQEKELIITLLDRYGQDFERKELVSILEKVYPDLASYLKPYRFRNELLDSYFQEYKYQKVVNKILPEFLSVVEKQAIDRDYNTILQPRSSLIESIDCTKSQTYFTDAMGVEFLGFIMAKCREQKLMAKVTVCRCELPSITSRNKEFWDRFSTEDYPIITVSDIDEIKHHGTNDYDYSKKKVPLHIIRELEIINGLLERVKTNLISGKYDKAILISDHGASRLAVIHDSNDLLEMDANGQHSGRCCPKSEVDVKPDNVTDADDFWALANYGRFKGGRRANVEVHGGATLEEVTVPIIEITYLNQEVEVKIMPLDAPATFTGVPEITVSFRKKAAIKIYITQRLQDVSIEIDGHFYDATETENNFYVVKEMPEIRRAKLYTVNVYACGNPIAKQLPLKVKKESGGERSIL